MQTKSGKDIFPIGIGTWDIGGRFRPGGNSKYGGALPFYENESIEIEAIRHSIDKGQNHIDTAEMYGGFYTDEVVGKAIDGYIREDLFIADKLWRTSLEDGLVRPTVEKMLAKLGTDYIDLLYIHFPWPDIEWLQAIPQIGQLIDEGVVRYVGVSNFTIAELEETRRITRHPIVANQMNYNVLNKTEVTDELMVYCKKHNIQIVAYQPIKRKEVMSNGEVQEIARLHGATPTQVALAWLLTRGAWAIPKAINKSHIDENIEAINLQLGADEMRILNQI